MRILLRNARAVLLTRTAERINVLIDHGRIVRLAESRSDESLGADSIIDLAGTTLFPGFIDVHMHGAVGIDTMSASRDDLLRVSGFLARQGVTGWLPTLVPAPHDQYERAIAAIGESVTQTLVDELPAENQELKSVPHARILGLHYEGPFVSSEQCGALHRDYFKRFESLSDIDDLATLKNSGAIQMMTLAPEINGGIDLIKELKQRGWIVSLGHTRATAEVLDQALAAGAHHMTHFMNAMSPLHHRSLGAVGWGLTQKDVTCDVIADGVHINGEILKLIVRQKSAENISLISDAVAAAGLGDGEYQIWGETIAVKDGRTQNSSGSIAGSVITVLDAVGAMLRLGFPESEVARMASLNPARLLGIEGECGSIEVGKRADLVALDENLNVRMTIIGGVEVMRDE